MPHLANVVGRVWSGLETAAACIAGVAMVCAMLLVTADALLRHLFDNPLTFQIALTEKYLLVTMILMAMPWGFRTGGYIRIDELTRRLPIPVAEVVLRAGLVAVPRGPAARRGRAGRERLAGRGVVVPVARRPRDALGPPADRSLPTADRPRGPRAARLGRTLTSHRSLM